MCIRDRPLSYGAPPERGIPYRCGIAAFGQKGYLCGKHHGMMKITSAGFAFSSGRISQIPDDGLPEFAFIGRSNAVSYTHLDVYKRQDHTLFALVDGTVAFVKKTNGRSYVSVTPVNE